MTPKQALARIADPGQKDIGDAVDVLMDAIERGEKLDTEGLEYLITPSPFAFKVVNRPQLGGACITIDRKTEGHDRPCHELQAEAWQRAVHDAWAERDEARRMALRECEAKQHLQRELQAQSSTRSVALVGAVVAPIEDVAPEWQGEVDEWQERGGLGRVCEVMPSRGLLVLALIEVLTPDAMVPSLQVPDVEGFIVMPVAALRRVTS